MRSARWIIVETAAMSFMATCAAIVLMNPEHAGGHANAHAGIVSAAAASSFNLHERLPSMPAPFTAAQLNEIGARLVEADAALRQARVGTQAQMRRLRRLTADASAIP